MIPNKQVIRLSVGAARITSAVDNLTDTEHKSYVQALSEGYTDEVCPKCEQVMLAHHHFVRCQNAAHGSCPMVPQGGKSLLERLMGDPDVKSVTVRPPGRVIGG